MCICSDSIISHWLKPNNLFVSFFLASRLLLPTFCRYGFPAAHVKERIIQNHELDNRPRLNTSSYVNVVSEPEERDVALMGMAVNLADGSVYPASVQLHDRVVNMIAALWNCPKPSNSSTSSVDSECNSDSSSTSVSNNITTTANHSGAGTVGSTEACLLAGLAHKFRWRKWYRQKHGMTKEEVMGIIPNIVISSCYQAAWEKLFRYFDISPRFIFPKLSNKMRIDANEIKALVDDKTIAVVGILGNHYNGAYDPIWDMDKVVADVNAEHGFQIGIHVDGASGGFIAPFQDNVPPFDFRLDNVLRYVPSTCVFDIYLYIYKPSFVETCLVVGHSNILVIILWTLTPFLTLI